MRRALLVVALLAGVPGCGDDGFSADLVSFNYCGNVCAEGADEGLTFVRELVDEPGASVVALQEICRSQAESLRAELAEEWGQADLAYVTTFAEDLDGANQCEGDDYGMALIARSILDEEVVPLPNPGLGERQIDERKILCVDISELIACTTHVVRSANDPEAHEAQIAAVGSFLAARRTAALVLVGDINEHEPLDAPGYAVGHHSLDHAYASRTVAEAVTTRTASCECSDHPALLVHFERS
jgi:endonuclease/exonuclease/phosphatase family metal-dependent hydrolase